MDLVANRARAPRRRGKQRGTVAAPKVRERVAGAHAQKGQRCINEKRVRRPQRVTGGQHG